MVSHKAHNLEVAGSSPASATNKPQNINSNMTKLTRDDLRSMKAGDVKKAPLEQLGSLRTTVSQMAMERVCGGMKMSISVNAEEQVAVVTCISPNTYNRAE